MNNSEYTILDELRDQISYINRSINPLTRILIDTTTLEILLNIVDEAIKFEQEHKLHMPKISGQRYSHILSEFKMIALKNKIDELSQL